MEKGNKMENLKSYTKIRRSGRTRGHSPHFVIITEIEKLNNQYELLSPHIFDDKKSAENWAKDNLKGKCFEVHKDYFTE